MSKYLDEAIELCKKKIMPDDIIEQLDSLKDQADEDEQQMFSWLYEAAYLQVDELTEE
jgi:hypothetical protein|tara:strand:+ start:43 stop:216 length:174 start_codon:yes stop_codon:yes gene_type:complete